MGPEAEALLRRLSPDDLVEGRHALLVDPGDRCRLRARARGADELRRRPGYELLVPDRPVPHALRRALERRAKPSGSGTQATTRSMRCASRPGAVPGARNSGRTKRRGKRAWATRSSSTSRRRSSAATRCCGSRRKGSETPPAVHASTTRRHFAWGGEPILMDGRNVGELTSAGYSRRHGRAIAMGYARAGGRVER